MYKSILVPFALATAAIANPAQAESGDILIKARLGYEGRSGSETANVQLLDGSHVSVRANDSLGGEASATFFVTDHVAVEASVGGSSYAVKDGAGHKLFSAGLLRPSMIFQFYPVLKGQFRPYIGAGVSYVSIFDARPGELLTNQLTQPQPTYNVSASAKVVPVAQIGADISINEKIYINIDGKYFQSSSNIVVMQQASLAKSPYNAMYLPGTYSQDLHSFVISVGSGFRF